MEISGCVFVGNIARHVMSSGPGFGGAIDVDQASIDSCTLIGNSGGTSGGVGGIRIDSGTVRTTILVQTPAGAACAGSGANWSCCNLYGNVMGDAICGIDAGGNFSADPLFCAVDPISTHNVLIQQSSPCAPGHHPPGAESCALIGAGTVGCTIAVARRSWSQIKGVYR
jgi:hypothetical protein